MPKRFCLECNRLFDKDDTGTRRCPDCQARRDRQRNAQPRANTTQRGLGHAHRQRVDQELAGITTCQCTGCSYCGPGGCGRSFTRDNPKTGNHLIPRSKGGGRGPLRAECRRCNSAKGNRQ